MTALSGCKPSDSKWTVLRQARWFSGYWKCDEAKIAEVVANSKSFLVQLSAETASEYQRREIEKILAHWDDFSCQVVCHTKNGKRMVHLNFFPRWKAEKEYLTVMDGGFWFWRAEFDYDGNQFVDFTVNGYA